MIQFVSQWPGRANSLANYLAEQLASFAATGISAIELPPLRQTQYGPTSASLGYDPIRDYDWGNCGTPTRIGTEAEIQAFVSASNALGIEITADFVDRQYGGKPPYVELDAAGKVDYNLFHKVEGLFDADPDNQFDPTVVPADGTLARYEFSEPAGYMLAQKTQANLAMCSALGLRGGRQDEAKSMWTPALRAIFAARPWGWNVAEYFSGDPALLWNFWNTLRQPVIDFPAHYTYRNISNGGSFKELVGGAFADVNPSGAYRMVENMDTDGDGGVVNNKLWFYLHGMTTPCRGFRVYAGDFFGYNLAKWIDNYAWISAKFAFGSLTYEYVEDDVICWSRDGNGGEFGQSGGLLCGISKDPINTRWIWVHTPFGPNRQLHNYATSGGPDIWTNADGWACVPFGPNVYGSAQNGFAYALVGQSGTIKLSAIEYTGA